MIKLLRLDDRLIHGQVVIGWKEYIQPDRIILCNDKIAQNKWERELYLTSAPPELKISIFTINDTIEKTNASEFRNEKIILLVDTSESLVKLSDRGLKFQKVNVGGLHNKKDGKKILPYIYLDNKDIMNFKTLADRNIILECQDLPDSKKHDLMELLKPYL